MGGLQEQLAGGGIGAAFVALIAVLGFVLRWATGDRKDSRRELAETDQRYETERRRHDTTQRRLDQERADRRAIEDRLADTQRQVTHLQEHVRQLETAMTRPPGDGHR